MESRFRSRRADLGLRLGGLLLCGIAYAALARLVAMHVPSQSAGALAYGLAAIGFLGASAGSAMAIHGHHLLEESEVSQRWRPCPRADAPFPADRGR